MRKQPEPGAQLWINRCGYVFPVEVRKGCSSIKQALVVNPASKNKAPWYCWIKDLYKTRDKAVEAACKYIRQQIKSNEDEITRLQRETKNLRDRLRSFEPYWYWIADLSIADCIFSPKRIPPVLKKGRIVDVEDDGTYRLVNDEGDSSFVPGSELFATAKAAWEHYNREHDQPKKKRKNVPFMERCCGNCDHHSWGAGPKDDGYIYCDQIKEQRHKRSVPCGFWTPEEED